MDTTEKDFRKALSQLTGIGFPSSVEWEIRLKTLFERDTFLVSYKVIKGNDLYTTVAYLHKKEATYELSKYEVTLLRYQPLPTNTITGIDIEDLKSRMAEMDWMNRSANKIAEEEFTTIEKLIIDLNKLAEIPEGALLAYQLRLRHWEGTSFESYIENASETRNWLEVSQRYYCFDGQDCIHLEEAYRFLVHRWTEKHLLQGKRKKGSAQLLGPENKGKKPAKKLVTPKEG